MRNSDRKKNIHKVNLLAEQRYINNKVGMDEYDVEHDRHEASSHFDKISDILTSKAPSINITTRDGEVEARPIITFRGSESNLNEIDPKSYSLTIKFKEFNDLTIRIVGNSLSLYKEGRYKILDLGSLMLIIRNAKDYLPSLNDNNLPKIESLLSRYMSSDEHVSVDTNF